MVIRPVAVGALAEAAVDIVANLDTFEPDLRRKLDAVMNRVGKDVQKRFGRMGRDSGKAFADGVATDVQKTAARDFERVGASAGDGFGKGLKRTSRAAAGDGGNEAGNFFSRSFETAASRAVGGALLRTFGAGIASLIVSATPLSTVLGGASAAVVALAAALSTASGSAIALGGVLGSLGLAAATLKIGFSGVGDAMTAQSKAQQELATTGKVSTATQEKLDAALKNLAPSAATVVKQLGAMAPAWQAVTRSIQERLFAGVGAELANLGNRFLPVLSRQLTITAGILNTTALAFGRFLNTSTRADQFANIFGRLNSILQTLLAPATAIAGAFLNIFQASLPFAQQLATTLANLTGRFAQFLNAAVASGGFNTFMQTAIALAGDLFGLLGNLSSIIGTVFGAGTAAGGGLLQILRDLTGQAAIFLKSAAGQSALASFFGLISQAGAVLSGIFSTLSPLLAGVSALFAAMSPALQAVGRAIQPVILALSTQLGASLAQLAPLLATLVTTGIGPLAAALGGILVSAVQGLTPIIAALVQGLTLLAPGITAVATVVNGLLVAAFQILGPLLSQLLTTLGALLGGFLQGFAPVLQVLGTALLQLLAPVAQLVQGFLAAVQAVTPLLPVLGQLNAVVLQLVLAFLPLVTTILQQFADLAIQIAPIIAQAVPWLTKLIQIFIAIVAAIIPVVAKFVQFGATVIQIFAALDLAILGFVAKVLITFGRLVVGVIGAAIRLGAGVIGAISSMVSAVGGFFSSLVSTVTGAIGRFASAVKAGVDKAVGFFRALPGQFTAAISGLAGALQTAGQNAIQGLINGLSGGLQRVRDIAGQIAGAITGPVSKLLKIGSPSKLLEQYGAWTTQGYAIGVEKLIPTVIKAANKLAKSASDTVRAQVNALSTSGTRSAAVIGQAMDALDNKIKTAGTRLADLVKQSGQLAQQVAQSIVATGDVTKSQDQSFAGIVTSLKNAVVQAASFNNVIARLKAAGLGETALQQIIAAGPETGSKIGQAILSAGKAGIQQINNLQSTLNRAANRAGETAANSLYAAGISAARGLVAGLNQQRAALDAQMIRLGAVLAKSLARVLGVKALPGLTVPGFAGGGIVSRPTLATVGEGYRKEAIIPLANQPRAAELMDKSGLTQFALERALGNATMIGGSGKTREIHMPVTVTGLTKEETIQILKDFLVNTFGGARIGLDLGDGVTL